MAIINQQRFEEVKLIFEQHNVNLSPDDVAIYSNVFEIISQFVHHKLTNQEIFTVYDLLSDVVKNNRPDIIAHVPKGDRIRVQVRLMEEMPETKGKLDLEEKVALAFCVYTGECVQIYDEERDMMSNGIVLFDSFEHIKNEFEFERKQFPSIFKIKQKDIVFDSTYGYSQENPINVSSIGASYCYLSKLRYNALPIKYERIGSLHNLNNDLVDKYDIFVEKKGLFKNKTIKVATIYINAYCDETLDVPPKDFTLA